MWQLSYCFAKEKTKEFHEYISILYHFSFRMSLLSAEAYVGDLSQYREEFFLTKKFGTHRLRGILKVNNKTRESNI